MAKNSAPTVNFNARINLDQKELIQRAADLRGITLTDFVLQAAHDRALETIERESVLKLALGDALAFHAAIEQPPEPTAEVLAAFRKAPRATIR
jgi:uncharacterized protein (DUF1778 family)